jgi:hypothetical protein
LVRANLCLQLFTKLQAALGVMQKSLSS